MKVFGGMGCGPRNNRLDFGGDSDREPDPGMIRILDRDSHPDPGIFKRIHLLLRFL